MLKILVKKQMVEIFHQNKRKQQKWWKSGSTINCAPEHLCDIMLIIILDIP